ncbi:MAG: HAMP domain-containing sensor histidine kinase [Candidatus Cloacimonadota bacterium]|nr:HAMP domain-containing sensor histidine kinase [Candidatus Cloacimonadota bacterium]
MPINKQSEKIEQMLNIDIMNNISLSRGKVEIILDMFKQLEDLNSELQKSEKMKSQFLSNIRNEINNPIASIVGLSDNVVRNKSMDANDIKQAVKIINSEALNLDFQLSNIFLAAELEAGEAQIETTQFEIKKFITDIFEIVKKLYSEKTIEFDISTSTDIEVFKTDSSKIEQVLKNIFENAIKFNDDKCKISVEYAVKDSKLSISIKDDGIGIREEDSDNIFSRFTQLATGSQKNYGGHGLGLAIVNNILELLNGEIKVESNENEGTKIMITIPESDLKTDNFLFEDDDFFFEDESEDDDGMEF